MVSRRATISLRRAPLVKRKPLPPLARKRTQRRDGVGPRATEPALVAAVTSGKRQQAPVAARCVMRDVAACSPTERVSEEEGGREEGGEEEREEAGGPVWVGPPREGERWRTERALHERLAGGLRPRCTCHVATSAHATVGPREKRVQVVPRTTAVYNVAAHSHWRPSAGPRGLTNR